MLINSCLSPAFSEHLIYLRSSFPTLQGLLTKIDSFHQIQLGCVYRGFTAISDEDVKNIYGGCYISQSFIKPDQDDHPKMKQLNDLFSVPEICLLANVTEYFIRNNIPYCPEILFYDVQVSN